MRRTISFEDKELQSRFRWSVDRTKWWRCKKCLNFFTVAQMPNISLVQVGHEICDAVKEPEMQAMI